MLRMFAGIGLFRLLVLLIFVVFLAMGLLSSTGSVPGVYIVTAVYWGAVMLIHLRRPDKIFMRTQLARHRRIWIVEYFILLLPLIGCLVYHFHWWMLLIVLLALPLFVVFKFDERQRSFNSRLQRMIPDNCFEWKSGIRKNRLLILFLWLVGMGAFFYVGTVPVVVFILGLLTIGFYEKTEPLQMLVAFEMKPLNFLFFKIRKQLGLFVILILPLILVFLIFHIEYWYIPLVMCLLLLSLMVYVILLKYAFYVPQGAGAVVRIYSAIGMFGIVIPFLLPVIWLLSWRFYFKSVENLNFYLNDFD